MERNFSVLGLGLMAVVACSEATSDDGEGGSGNGTTTATAATGATTKSTGATGTPSSTSPATTGTDATASSGVVALGDVVINEISATEDFIELFNTGAAAFDLGGKTLADLDDTTMGPKLDEAISFPAGTSIAPGGYLFILAKQDAVVMPGEQMPQTECAPGVAPCFYAPFGLSDGDGDAIFLLDGMTTIARGDYPAAAAPEGQTWCRLPDGTGAFSVCASTPGAANAAP